MEVVPSAAWSVAGSGREIVGIVLAYRFVVWRGGHDCDGSSLGATVQLWGVGCII